MATAATKITEFVFEWEGRDRNGKQVRGETRAAGENQCRPHCAGRASLRPGQEAPDAFGAKIKPKTSRIFTRQRPR